MIAKGRGVTVFVVGVVVTVTVVDVVDVVTVVAFVVVVYHSRLDEMVMLYKYRYGDAVQVPLLTRGLL
jgi:hypothetical protein